MQIGKKVAILQSNYIPWKGYFDMVAAVDEFILYDDVQFTKNDWRNRNLIKTPKGAEWISIPTGQNIKRKIRDVEVLDQSWKTNHWKKLNLNYGRSPHYKEVAQLLENFYVNNTKTNLSEMNRELIEQVCHFLGIETKISYSWDYSLKEGKTERLVDLCIQAGATEYISGPAAKEYINEDLFKQANITLTWFDYNNYPEYKQLWGDFIHGVSILDLLFNCGRNSNKFMRYLKG